MWTRTRLPLALAIGTVALITTTPNARAAEVTPVLPAGYTVEDLGPLGGVDSFASGCNAAGQIIAVAQLHGTLHAILLTPAAGRSTGVARTGAERRTELGRVSEQNVNQRLPSEVTPTWPAGTTTNNTVRVQPDSLFRQVPSGFLPGSVGAPFGRGLSIFRQGPSALPSGGSVMLNPFMTPVGGRPILNAAPSPSRGWAGFPGGLPMPASIMAGSGGTLVSGQQ
jgi:hypothetical protein